MTRTVNKSLYVELNKFKLRDTAIATGPNCNIVMGTPNPGDHWFIERVAVHSNTVNTTVNAYLLVGDDPQRGIDWTSIMDVTLCGADDAADEHPAVYAQPGEEVKMHWTGLTAGDEVWANLQISRCQLIAAELPDHIDFERFAINIDTGPT